MCTSGSRPSRRKCDFRCLKSSVVLAFALSLLPALAFAQHYNQTNLVSNVGAPPVVNDSNLRNGWGLVHGPTTPWWIADNADGKSTVYNAAGLPSLPVSVGSVVVTIPHAPSQPAPWKPNRCDV
jgi:hypothetical protein